MAGVSPCLYLLNKLSVSWREAGDLYLIIRHLVSLIGNSGVPNLDIGEEPVANRTFGVEDYLDGVGNSSDNSESYK